MTTELIILIICLFLSGFFSSSETALFSISQVKALHISKDGSKVDKLILYMKKDSHKLLTTILIGNNLVNICASALATKIAIEYFKSNAVGIATGIMTFLILVVGEIFPKSFATQNNIFVARVVIIPIFWLSKLFTPIIFLLNFIPKIIGVFDKSPFATEDELITMVEVIEEEGEIKEEEKEFITNIFEFDDTSASEIMTPRADVFVIDIENEIDIKSIIESGFTRVPVMKGNIDNIVGIINVKYLFAEFHKSCADNGSGELDIKKIMQKPNFIPDSKKLDSLLHEFKKLKNHLGVVIDEHGGMSGIVTLEDVVEEIVGEITDETDKLEPDITKIKGGNWLVAGKIDIDELNKKTGLSIPEANEYDTFSGYVLNMIGRIPEVGETIKTENCTIIVREKDGNRIKRFVLKIESQKIEKQ
ncbi:MAG: HlyC/CorC family transporter [Desulfobacteraceae bacterium]|nr:HlyC/CorC family transporter [Desulfobacteraceae bacterium]